MAQRDTQSETSAAPNLFPAGLAELGQKRIEVMVEAQKHLFDEAQDISQNLLDRGKAESQLAAELANRLTAARSIPEALTAWQQWGSRRMEMAAQDAQWALSNSFKLLESGARAFSNGGSAART